jgi:hypothetical protein
MPPPVKSTTAFQDYCQTPLFINSKDEGKTYCFKSCEEGIVVKIQSTKDPNEDLDIETMTPLAAEVLYVRLLRTDKYKVASGWHPVGRIEPWYPE